MPRRKLADTEIRDKKISVRVNEKEFYAIKHKAKMYAVATPEYLRSLGLNYPITCHVDSLAFLELGRCRADLGRLGGLLKMWLTDKDRKSGLDEIDIKILLKQIEIQQEEVVACARKLVEIGGI